MSAALLPQEAAFAPRGMSLVQSGLYKVRVAWSTRLAELKLAVAEDVALGRARVAAAAQRVAMAFDPSVSPAVARYQVSEGHALAQGRVHTRAPAADATETWVRPVELAAAFLDVHHRRALARHWLTQGQAAHASIAAYSNLATELLTLGAHPDLLMHVHAAALERVHHAEGAFSFASAYAGFGISPSAWPDMPRFARPARHGRDVALARLAERALLEGWLSTAYGAGLAGLAAARAADDRVASHLRMVATDGARQATFGARLVDWALQHGGEQVGLTLALAVRNLPRALPEARLSGGLRAETLERHGVAPQRLRRAVYLSTREQVIAELSRKLDHDEWRRAERRKLRSA